MKELFSVLPKWNKGTYRRSRHIELAPTIVCCDRNSGLIHPFKIAVFIPPKQDQAFNQGGTFLFDGPTTVFAHFDAGTGAHSDIQTVIDMAKQRLEEAGNKKN